MSIYKGSQKIKDIYFGTPNTNCLTYIHNDINLELDPLNVTVTGSPTVSSGVVSGFSTSNYLTIPKRFPAKATNFEFVFKFKSSSFSSWQYWFNTAPHYSFLLGTSSSGKIVLYASSNTTSWDISNGIEGVTTLNTNSWYYVKCTYDGQTYKVYISTDKVNWNSEITISSIMTVGVAYDVCWIGNGWVDQAGVNTTIDLSQSYIKINGSTWWKGGTGNLTLKKGSKVYVPNGYTSYKYYKYTYENWTQPVMSSNNQNGIKLTCANMSSSNIYTLFNGVSNSDYITPTSTSSYNSYVNIAFDYPIKLSNIKINSYTKHNVTYAFGECKIVATTKDGQEITISTAKLPDSQAWADTNFPVDNLVIKNLRIYATSGGNPHPRIGEITLTAQKQTGTAESTSSDYDYKVGSGSMIFDEVVTTSDEILTLPNYGTQSNIFIFYRKSYADITAEGSALSFSGSTSPTGFYGNYAVWYDTNNNKIKHTTDGGSTWNEDQRSFPLCTVSTISGVISSIDQVFNGFGYIGHSIYMLPNVKFLCSEGFNSDGTYKNTEYIVPSVKVKTYTDNIPNAVLFSDKGNLELGVTSRVYEVENTLQTPASYYERVYVRSENQWYYHTKGGTSWLKLNTMCVLGKGELDNTNGVTYLTPNPVQPEKIGRKITRVYKGSTLVYGYKPNQVLFESSTAGTSTLNIEHSGYYELTVVGGGSGGAFEYSAKYADGAAGGGSGGGLIGVAYLQAGTYSITVGSGGAGAWDNNSREWISASAGGSSSFGSIVTANGGTVATARYNNGSQTAGQGGTVSYTASAFRSVSLNKQGNAGATATNASTSATYSGGESVYGGYGAGGKAQYGGAYAGGTGYVKVVAI